MSSGHPSPDALALGIVADRDERRACAAGIKYERSRIVSWLVARARVELHVAKEATDASVAIRAETRRELLEELERELRS